MQSVETQIIPRTSDIGNLTVRRALPSREKRSVGSFVFWDQFGPGELIQDVGLDVRPHPHIGLSTFSYLFAGTMQHRDSLGNDIVIGPGAVNLMTAGSGIVHSERSDPDSRANLSEMFGIQSWLALPRSWEETAASFDHYGESRLPQFSENGVEGRVLLGDWSGLESPVSFPGDSMYVDLRMSENSAAQFPKGQEERAIFSAQGAIEIDGILYPEYQSCWYLRRVVMFVWWPPMAPVYCCLVVSHSMDRDISGGILCHQVRNELSRQKVIGWVAVLLRYLGTMSLFRCLRVADS